MSLKNQDAIQRLFAQFIRDTLPTVPPEQQAQFQQELQDRGEQLSRAAGAPARAGDPFTQLLGFDGGAAAFDDLGVSDLPADFEEYSAQPTQLAAAADLYFVYQYERMKVFAVADTLVRLSHEGRIRIQRGPGARALYLLEKRRPLRYSRRDRLHAYRRVFNYGDATTAPQSAVYRGFHRQFVALHSAIAQYTRDLLIGEVIRGAQLIEQRPFGSQATIQRLGTDLRWGLDRATYGHVVSLTLETGEYLKTVLDMLETPDIRRAFDANTKWDVIEFVSQRHLGGVAELSQRSKLADAGRRMLRYVANEPFKTRDFHLFQAQIQPLGPVAEEWIAAFRMTPRGRNFPGVATAMRDIMGTQTGHQTRAA